MFSRGEYKWREARLIEGVSQTLAEDRPRYRLIRNMNWLNAGSMTKDRGWYGLNAAGLVANDSGLRMLNGVDADYINASGQPVQAVLVFQEDYADVKIHAYDGVNRSFDVEPVALQRGNRPCPVMFANNLCVFDGLQMRARAFDGTWSTPGDATFSNPSRFATVYASRLCAAGNPTYPQSFFPSGVRRNNDWDEDLIVDVTGAGSDAITCLGLCGTFLIVGGRTFTQAHYLGTASPKDWDHDSLSTLVGPTNWASFVNVSLARGNEGQAYSFFWSDEGPMVIVQQGQGIPSIYPLWDPIRQALRGTEYEDHPAFDLGFYDDVQGVWVPEYREVRFSTRNKTVGAGHNDTLLCLNIDSVRGWIAGARDIEPAFRIRDNTNNPLPAHTVFPCRMNEQLNRPDPAGQVRMLAGDEGLLYEADVKNQRQDPGNVAIPFSIKKDNYKGLEDGIDFETKSNRTIHLAMNRPGNYTLYAKLVDASGREKITEIPCTVPGGSAWGDGGKWADGGKWTDKRRVRTVRAGLHLVGTEFSLELYDNGGISSELQIASWMLAGMVEGRR